MSFLTFATRGPRRFLTSSLRSLVGSGTKEHMLRTLLLVVAVAFGATSLPASSAEAAPSKWSMKSKSKAKSKAKSKSKSKAKRKAVARKSTKATKRSKPKSKAKSKRATKRVVEKRPLLI